MKIPIKAKEIIHLRNCYFYRSIGLTPEMDSTGSIAAIEAAIDRLNTQRNELEELWAMRKVKLDLYLRLRIFERDALEVIMLKILIIYFLICHGRTFKIYFIFELQISSEIETWSRNLDKNENILDAAQAEQSLQIHTETVSCLRNNIFQIMQQGEQLSQVGKKRKT